MGMDGRPQDGPRRRMWVRWAGSAAALAVVILPVAVLPALLQANRSGGEEMTWEERNIAVGVRCLRIQVADTPQKQGQGLRDRDSLGEYDGMLFPFDSTSDQRAFTMSGVKFALTIGFYDDAGHRVDALDMEPCSDDEGSCPLYRSKAPFRAALEVAKGQLPEGSYVPTCPA